MNNIAQIPLFPLPSIVLPEGVLPLRLFEQRYINMVKTCFKTATGFGVCLIKDGSDEGSPAIPYPQGTLVSIIDFDQGRDGLLHITTQGDREFDLHDFKVKDDGLLVGNVTFRPSAVPAEMSPDAQGLARKLDVILEYLEPGVYYEHKRLDDADWVCNRLLELLPIASDMKYDLLSMDNNTLRIEALAAMQIEIASREF